MGTKFWGSKAGPEKSSPEKSSPEKSSPFLSRKSVLRPALLKPEEITKLISSRRGEGEQEARSECWGQTWSREEVAELAYYNFAYWINSPRALFTCLPLGSVRDLHHFSVDFSPFFHFNGRRACLSIFICGETSKQFRASVQTVYGETGKIKGNSLSFNQRQGN